MEKLHLLFCLCLITSCSNGPEFVEPKIGYIDYLNYPEDKLTQGDRFLLASVDFQEGVLSTSLDTKSALEQGVSETRFNYFLEFLQNENQKFEKYLDAGAIVFYNGKPFTRNKDLLQYIDVDEVEFSSRARYEQQVALGSKTFVMGYDWAPTDVINFNGPCKISTSVAGQGSFRLKEESKNLTVLLDNAMSTSKATLKWGFGNNVDWSWKVTYNASTGGTKATLFFTGYLEEPMPPEDPTNPDYVYFWKNIPSYILIYKDTGDQTIHVGSTIPGTFTAQLYKFSRPKRTLYAQQDFNEQYGARLRYPLECTFWVVIYRKIIRQDEVTYDYLGDTQYPYPPYPNQKE